MLTPASTKSWAKGCHTESLAKLCKLLLLLCRRVGRQQTVAEKPEENEESSWEPWDVSKVVSKCFETLRGKCTQLHWCHLAELWHSEQLSCTAANGKLVLSLVPGHSRSWCFSLLPSLSWCHQSLLGDGLHPKVALWLWRRRRVRPAMLIRCCCLLTEEFVK